MVPLLKPKITMVGTVLKKPLAMETDKQVREQYCLNLGIVLHV
jgi:hypothetical protein